MFNILPKVILAIVTSLLWESFSFALQWQCFFVTNYNKLQYLFSVTKKYMDNTVVCVKMQLSVLK